ncbi:MAG: UDP-N-acetylglucosamine 1-carboxyvinyltransferase [Candidatus Binatia bacterium]|nr:MAG: UDP-N-acetylglucosamine 1-carboxyvinyltransferase [Candidatus Binatia bacterium]
MDRLVVRGGKRLRGTVAIAGNKNAAGPALAAALLTEEPVVVGRVPEVQDVAVFRGILEGLGAEVLRREDGSWEVRSRGVHSRRVDPELGRKIRMSLLCAGPLLARFGEAVFPPPGGDVIGRRRIDTHLLAFAQLGARIEAGRDGYRLRASKLRGAEILLDEMSVTATENALMAAVLAEGTTVLRNAASEPHVQDLCHLLVRMGASIEGIGTNRLVIHGVERLHGASYELGPDYLEVGSFIGLAAVTGSTLRLRDCRPEEHEMTRIMFGRLGVEWTVDGSDIVVPGEQRLEVVDDHGHALPKIDDAPWPGFPADLISIATVVATQARGAVLIHEKLYESRLYFVDRLISMGARIVLCDPHRAVVIGPSRLYGQNLVSPDIRAGMALLIAALCAEGQSVIDNASQIGRGYEHIAERLSALGADVSVA